MTKRIVLLVLALTVALMGAWAGGKQEEAEAISIMFQGPETEQAAFKGAAERFTAETGIKVETLYTPHDVYNEKVAGLISAKDLPDIMQLDAPFLCNYVWNGYIVSVAEYIDKDIIADMTPSNIAQCTYPIDNKLYAVNHFDSTVLLYANRRYLERIGARIPKSVDDAWSVEEFEGYLAALAELPEVMYPLDIMRAYGVKTEWGTYAFYPAFVSAGGGLIDRKTWRSNGTLNSPESIRVAKMFQRWAQNGWIVPASAGDNLLFNENRDAAIAWCGHWMWPGAYASLGDDLIALPLPDFGNGTVTPNGTWILAITKDANKETVGKFISYMLKNRQFLDEWQAINSYPALKSWAARYETYSNPNKMAIAAEQANYAVARPPHPAYPTITSAFMKAFDDILSGADVKSALDKAADMIDEDIEDHDGYPPFGK